jgi:hypothetical protein
LRREQTTTKANAGILRFSQDDGKNDNGENKDDSKSGSTDFVEG